MLGMESNIIIGTALNKHARFYLGDTTKLVDDAGKIHDMWPTSLAALGRTMAVTSVMALMQKNDGESVTTTINGGGSIGTVLATADSEGNVKGFVGNNHLYLKYNDSNKLAVGLVVGTEGYLKVIRDLKMRNSYTTQVALRTGEIGDDFAYYFSVSEQRPSIVSVGVLVDTDYSCKASGVLIIELLPDHTEEDIVYLENLKLQPISSVIESGISLQDYIHSLFDDAEILEKHEVRYHCDCSKERFLRNLLTLSKDDIDEIIADGHIDVQCQFCDKEYHFDKEDIELLKKYAEKNR